MTIEAIINEIIRKEGGFVNHPDDRGGPTKYGIVLKEYEAWRKVPTSIADLQRMSSTEAYSIYMTIYFIRPGFKKIYDVSPAIAEELVDTGVNMGIGTASIFFQRILNAFNNKQNYYSDLVVDGKIGPQSISALKSYLKYRDEIVFLKALNGLQAARYIELSEKREANESFVYGWISNRVKL